MAAPRTPGTSGRSARSLRATAYAPASRGGRATTRRGAAAAPRRADRHGVAAGEPRLVDPGHQRRQHVARLLIEVVPRSVEVRRHHAHEVAAVLAPAGLAQLDARDLRHGVPLVRRLEGAGEQLGLRDRLPGQARIDAGRRQVHQLLDSDAPGSLDDVAGNQQVAVEEVRRPRVVGENAADRAGGDEDRVRTHRGEPVLHIGLPAQIQDAARGGERLAALRPQAPEQGRAHHAAMAGDPHAPAVQHRGRRIPAGRHRFAPAPVVTTHTGGSLYSQRRP